MTNYDYFMENIAPDKHKLSIFLAINSGAVEPKDMEYALGVLEWLKEEITPEEIEKYDKGFKNTVMFEL